MLEVSSRGKYVRYRDNECGVQQKIILVELAGIEPATS